MLLLKDSGKLAAEVKTIYLHIGMGKTGTTSIQRFLSLNHACLLKEGVHYLLAGGGATGHGHQPIAKACIDDIPEYMEVADASVHIKQVQREISTCESETIVLSSENFQLANPTKVKRILDQACPEYRCKVILIVRSQDELLESEYNQMVKVKSVTYSLADYARDHFNGDFMRLASLWESVFGRDAIVSRVYSSVKRDIIPDFLSCLPLSLPALDALRMLEPVFVNPSLDLQQLSRHYTQNQTQTFSSPKHVSEPANVPGPAVFMNNAEATAFRKQFHESNFMFSSRFLDRQIYELGGTRFSDVERDQYSSYWKTFQSRSQGNQ